MKKKVVSIVLNNFFNDSRVLKEALTLKKAGYGLVVVALHEEPLKENEVVNGINVHRIKLKTRNWSKNKIIQLIKYFEFLYKVVKKYKNIDVVHCHDLNALPVGVLIKKYYNKHVKVVYDAHEYETESNGVSGFYKRIVKQIEKKLIKNVSEIITVSDSIANEYAKLYNIKKPTVVLNTPRYQKVAKSKNLFRNIFNIDEDKSIFLYQGNLTKGRGVESLLEAFSNMDSKFVIIFMGYGILEGTIKEYQNKYSNIFFKEAVSPNILLDYTSSADYGVSLIEDICLSYRYCLPNKMFEYLMAGLPLIVSNLPEMKKIVVDYGVGIVADNNTEEGLKNALYDIVTRNKNNLVNNTIRVTKLFNWEEQEKILLDVYESFN